MFQASTSIDDQYIMERTGHRNLEGVCSYKPTSNNQREAHSDILNSGPKKFISGFNSHRILHCYQQALTLSDDYYRPQVQLMTQNMLTSQSLAMNILRPQSFTFNSCSMAINKQIAVFVLTMI